MSYNRFKAFAVLMVLVLMVIITGCSSSDQRPVSQSSPAPSVSASTGTMPSGDSGRVVCSIRGNQSTLPSFFNPEKLARRFPAGSVDADQFARGIYVAVVCGKSFDIDVIGAPTSPIVTVNGIGKDCVVVGSSNNPATVKSTANVLVACPAGKASA